MDPAMMTCLWEMMAQPQISGQGLEKALSLLQILPDQVEHQPTFGNIHALQFLGQAGIFGLTTQNRRLPCPTQETLTRL
jgi:hypothetical protein